MNDVKNAFDLTGKVAIVTGGSGLLGVKHCEAIAEMGGIPWLIDINKDRLAEAVDKISNEFDVPVYGRVADITIRSAVEELKNDILKESGRIDILINNAANNPKVEGKGLDWSRFENFPLDVWESDIKVGLTGAMICSQVFGQEMASQNNGVILNIASDLGIIGPDQRIYKNDGETFDTQSVKPVTYSVVKSGLIGLTKYLSTYWAHKGVRANALAPGGVEAGQADSFKQRLTNLIPMGRMANQDEYKSAIVFMVSNASSYMNGSVISMDGGRTAW